MSLKTAGIVDFEHFDMTMSKFKDVLLSENFIKISKNQFDSKNSSIFDNFINNRNSEDFIYAKK